MTPDKKDNSKKLEKDKSVEETLAELDKAKQKIQENVKKILRNITEIGTEASKINFTMKELKKLIRES